MLLKINLLKKQEEENQFKLNNMGIIIGLAGRMRSGKGTLADVCAEHGYKRLYFALPLKQLCAKFMKTTVEQIDEWKNRNENITITFSQNDIRFFSEETGISMRNLLDAMSGKHVNNIRELLQFIGTDVIRAYNENWHVDKIRDMIDENENYVLEDVRFRNEVSMINEFGGITWFIVKPDLNNVSHHISEESLFYYDCGYNIIVNDKSESYIRDMWGLFLENYDIEKRKKTIIDLAIKHTKGEYIEWHSNEITDYDKMLIHRDIIEKENEIVIDKSSVENITQEGKTVHVKLIDGRILNLTNALDIEDAKIVL